MVKIISWMGTFTKTKEQAIQDYKSYMSYCDPGSSEYSRYASNIRSIENGCREIYE